MTGLRVSQSERAMTKNSLFFSLLAGNLGVETGSTATASATNICSQMFAGVRKGK